MASGVDLKLTIGSGRIGSPRRRDGDPLRILVIGDFAGCAQRKDSLLERRIHPIDVDEFDRTLARIAPRAELPAADSEPPTGIGFDSLESFHPDSLYGRLESLAKLRDLRARLCSPAQFEAASRELLAAATAARPPTSAEAREERGESADELTRRLLGRPATEDESRPDVSPLDGVIRRLIEPLIQKDPLAEAGPYLAAVDEATAAALRTALSAPGLKRLEASWRGLRSLVDRLEPGDTFSLTLLDAAREELEADLIDTGDGPGSTQLYRRIVEGREDQLPDLIVLDVYISPDHRDLGLLGAVGAIGASIGAPVLASAALTATRAAADTVTLTWTMPGSSAAADWAALRTSEAAPWIGLAAPRLLLRQPYGTRSDPIDAFEFEEIADASDHEAYLWGSPAYGCALLIGQAFAANGWDMQPGDELELDDLPACIVPGEHGRTLKPCAEHLLSERVTERLLGEGLMPFASYRDRNACRLARFQSISATVQPLAGRWSG